MTKSLLTGIAIFTALAVFAGNANVYKAHALKTHKTTTTSTRPPLWMPVPNRSRVNTGPHGNDPIYESCEYPGVILRWGARMDDNLVPGEVCPDWPQMHQRPPQGRGRLEREAIWSLSVRKERGAKMK
jgi:hypothetical protein